MLSTSFLELDPLAYQRNLAFVKEELGEKVKISSVVKGNAYGHGIEELVPMAFEAGINHFSVFSADEAYRVKRIAPSVDVMIMGQIDLEDLTWAIENHVDFYVFEPERLDKALEVSKKLDLPAHIHLEVETGMNRTGLDLKELDYCAELLLKNPRQLLFKGFATHYAGAESIANYLRIKKQYRLYNKALKRIETKGLKPELRHTACSAASISYPKTRMDMVRMGIIQYGFWPSMETRIRWMTQNNVQESPLHRVISWKSRIMSIKKVKTGEFVGYGTTFLAQKDTLIAAVPVGYSHGYSRSLSNQGRVLVCGKRTAVIGTVNMNAMVIDISDIPEAKIGDEVILIGEVGDVEVSVASFSELSNQLNYELLTRLPNDIPRKILGNKD